MGSSPGPTGIRLLRAPEESPRLEWVGKGGVEPPRPFGHTDLNRARLPFRHLPWRATTLSAGRCHQAGGSIVARSPRSPDRAPTEDLHGADPPALRGVVGCWPV